MKRRKAKKAAPRRRRARVGALNQKDLSVILTNQVLPLVGGVVLGKYLPDLLVKVDAKAGQYANYIALAGGIALAATQKGSLAAVGLGLAAGGGAGVVDDLMDGSKANGLGLLPAGQPTVYLAGPGDAGTETMLGNTILKVQ